MLHIIDVSGYQGTTVPAVDAVFVKATEGSGYTNDKFAKQYASAKSRAKHRGAYHFARPEQSSARSQADRFLDVVQPVVGESVWLDLEASGLNQAKTHAWAEDWAARVVDQARSVTYGSYLGSGYASNNTGKDLADVFPLWWYPQYPSAYQLTSIPGDMRIELEEQSRALNRSSLIPDRTPIAAMTTRWPTEVTPWLPSGLTFGKAKPDIWQFTDNWSGLDASVTALTLDQLAGGGGQPTPMEIEMLSGKIPSGKGDRDPILFPAGVFKTIEFGWDNTYTNSDLGITRQGPAQLRIALHQKGRKGTVPATVVVGATLDDTKGWADNVSVTLPAGCDRIDVTRLDEGVRSVGFCVA